MKFGILGRTDILLQTSRLLIERGHTLTFAGTAKSSSHDSTQPEHFAAYAQENRVPFFTANELHGKLDRLRATNTDVVLSINWPSLLTEPILSLFPHGILNAHAGDLPRYRGNAVANWAILNGESQIGLTIHRMTAELDAGPILKKSYFPLYDESYIRDVYSWLAREIPRMFADVLDGLSHASIQEIDQIATGLMPLRVYPRKREDSQIFWDKSNISIHRLIRASSHPFDGAFAFTQGGEQVTIWRAALYEPEFEFLAVPGQICFAIDGDPVVACGSGMIRLHECTCDEGTDARGLLLSSLRNRLV